MIARVRQENDNLFLAVLLQLPIFQESTTVVVAVLEGKMLIWIVSASEISDSQVARK